MDDGTKIKYRAITRLDGSVYFQVMIEGDSQFSAASKKLNIKAGENITPKQALEVIDKDATITLDKTEGYESVMNPKMFDRLTSEQQQRVDPKRAKKTKGETKFSKTNRSKAVDAVNEIEQKLKNKLKVEGKVYTKEEFQKSNEFNSIFRSINLDNGPINNYIKSLGMSPAKTQKTIESVSDRLLKYNPQAERKTDSKKEITIGERIMSDTQFAKLDAARDLAIEGKRETPTDIGETTKEGDVKLQVAAEPDAQQETLETEDISPQAEARRVAEKAKGKQKVESEFRRKIGIETGSDLYNKILNTARKALLRAYETGKTVRQIQRDLRDEANLYLFKDIKNFLGTKQYVSNLNKFREPIMKVMFTADLVQMEREVADDKKVFTKFVKKITTLKEVENAVEQRLLPPSALNSFKRDKSVNLYEKANPTEKQFLSFFNIPTINPVTGVRSGKRGTRKDQLAKYMSGALTYDATLEIAQEPEIAQKRADIAELKGETLAQDDVQQLAAAIERNPNVKFSLTGKKLTKETFANQNMVYHLDNTINNIDLVAVDRDDNNKIIRYYFKKPIQRVIGPGSKTMKQKDQDLIAELAYKIHNDNRFARPESKNYEKLLLGKIIKLAKKVQKLNMGIAHQIDNENTLKKEFSSAFTFLKGRGDIYAAIENVIFGFEVKLGEAQGVSQLLSYTKEGVNFPNKNQTTNQDNKLHDDVIGEKMLSFREDINKFLQDSNVELIEDFTKKLSEEQIKALKPFRSLFQINETVNIDYIMSAYASGKYASSPQGFMITENKLYLMKTGNQDIDALHASARAEYNKDKNEKDQIPFLELNTEIANGIDVVVSLDIVDGKIKYRVRPLLIGKNFKNSNVNINEGTVAKDLGKALETVAVNFSKSSSGKTISKAVQKGRLTSFSKTAKGISILDFDDTLATTKSLVKYTGPDGTTGT